MTKLGLAALVAGNFMLIVDVFIVHVALREIQVDLGTSEPQLQSVVVAYSLVFGAFLLIGARLGDRFGRRRVYLSGTLVFLTASASCGIAQTPDQLIWARAVQGLGASMMMPQVYASLRVLFENSQRDRAFAIMGVAQGMAGVVSQMLGGLLILLSTDLGWRTVFLVNIPIAIGILVIGRTHIPETKSEDKAYLDILGSLLGVASLGLLLGGLMNGPNGGWGLVPALTLLAGAAVFILFLKHQSRLKGKGATPIFDVDLLRNAEFGKGVVGIFLLYSAIGSFAFSLTMWLQGGLGFSPLLAGSIFTPSAVFFFLGSLFLPRLQEHFGAATLPIGVCTFSAGLLIAVGATAVLGFNLPVLIASLVLIGLGQGIAIPLALSTVVGSTRSEDAGLASGMVSTVQMVGSAFGVALVGVLFFATLAVGVSSPAANEASFTTSFAVATGYNLAATLLSALAFVRITVRAKTPNLRSGT